MSNATKPTPFELASLAALLALQNNQSGDGAPENLFPQAEQLLNSAKKYLMQHHQLDSKWMGDTLGYTTSTFDDVLKPVGRGRKKPQTMVGNITTHQGLKKAIRRVFPEKANEILHRGTLYGSEIDAIIADQKRANQARTRIATKARINVAR